MKKRRFVLLIWLFFLGIILTASTYAWFSANRIFEIESFDIQVATKGGFEISTDAIDWKGVVGMLDLIETKSTYPSNVNEVPNSVTPVSTSGDVENGRLNMFLGTVNIGKESEYYLYSRKVVEKPALMDESFGTFVVFDLFFRTKMPRSLSIGPNSSILYREGSLSSGIENAFRVGFINQGYAPLRLDEKTYQNLNNGTESIIWEVNYDTHTPSAVEHALNIYGITTSENDSSRLPYYGIKKEIPGSLQLNVKDANEAKYPEYFSLVEPQIATKKEQQGLSPFINISAGVTKIRTYIWLEGQDVDCEDASNWGNLAINLEFVAS